MSTQPDGVNKRRDLAELALINRERAKRSDTANPSSFGWPDLLRPQGEYEEDSDFAQWRREAVRNFVENEIFFVKDGKRIDIFTIDGSKDCPKSMMNLIYDCFYGHTDQAILWKPRGSGGSISVSIIIFMIMLYRKMSFTLIAGSEKQAKVVYKYVMQLWECNPPLASAWLKRNPTMSLIECKKQVGGMTLECITATQKSARGIHTAGLVIDECSQKDFQTDKAIEAALQGPMSEKERCIMACSTFHNATGLYQELWDFADEKGYTKYRWDIIDCIVPDTEILTKVGYKPVQSISTEDDVLDINGIWQPVTKVWEKESTEQRLRFSVEGGSPYPVTVTAGHLIHTLRTEQFQNGSSWKSKYSGNKSLAVLTETKPVWVAAGDIRVGDHVALPRPKRVEDWNLPFLPILDTYPSRGGSKIRAKFEDFSSPDFMRFVGYFVGDGHAERNRVTFVINDRDQDWISDLYNLARDLFGKEAKIDSASQFGTRIRINSKGLSDWCRKYLYKDKVKFFDPDCLAVLSDESIKAYLTGNARADACVRGTSRKYKYNIEWAGKSPYLQSCMIYCLLRLGISPSLRRRGDLNLVSWDRRKTKFIDPTFVCAEDRTKRIQLVNEDFVFCRVNNIEAVEDIRPVYDLTVEGGESFVAGLTLAHNTMEPCRLPIDCRKCYLTDPKPQYDKKGNPTSIKYSGCAGRARTTTGWQNYEQLVTAKKQNEGTTVWEVEFLCNRPETGRTIYPTEKIVQAQKSCPKNFAGNPYVPYDKDNCEFSIGVDWGIVQTAVVLLVKTPEYLGVLESRAFSGQPLSDITRYLQLLHKKYRPGSMLSPAEKAKLIAEERRDRKKKIGSGVSVVSSDDNTSRDPITVYGDSSHPFNNIELGQLGYIVMPVQFNQFKDLGIENMVKYFWSGRIMIPKNDKNEILLRQLMLYSRDEKGKPVKKDDHFPDALMCAGIGFLYIEHHGETDLQAGIIPQERDTGVAVMEL